VRNLCYKCNLINLRSKELLANDATHSSAEKACLYIDLCNKKNVFGLQARWDWSLELGFSSN
jgi:hypothetical protein